MTCFASNFELRLRFSDPEGNRRSPLQKRTYTFASDALHTLQRVHRDRNARARTFPPDAALVVERGSTNRPKMSVGRLRSMGQTPGRAAGPALIVDADEETCRD
jgi:hypothetical protein